MMLATVALILELAGLIPRMAEAGMAVAGLVAKMRTGLNDVPADQREGKWNEADVAVDALVARAFDPATDQAPAG